MHQSDDPMAGKAGAHTGAIMQLGYVVADMDAALAHWTRDLGVGPFVVTSRIEFAELRHRGTPINIHQSVALASWNGMQIELIQQVSGDDSLFTRFLARRGGGLHHVCLTTDDMDRDLAAWRARGVGILMDGITVAGIRFAYLDSDPDDQGRVIEIVQPTPGLTRFFARLAQLSTDWDGTDPIRHL